jgi:hypothetical protein
MTTTKFIVMLASLSVLTFLPILMSCAGGWSTPVKDSAVNDIPELLMPCSHFASNDLILEIDRQDGGYVYLMENHRLGTKINLSGGKLTKLNGKHYYKWHNQGTIYQVTWQPRNSGYARVQAFNRGKRVFNQLLKLDGVSGCD